MLDEYIPSLMKQTVTVEKKAFDVLQKNNLDLMEKLNKAEETLAWIVNCKPVIEVGYPDIIQKARDCLEEIKE